MLKARVQSKIWFFQSVASSTIASCNFEGTWRSLHSGKLPRILARVFGTFNAKLPKSGITITDGLGS
jgi:hypothetical protein